MNNNHFQESNTNKIGIVVIGKNEGERLRLCFESINFTAFPVVYVDSASTDGSVELARKMGVPVLELDISRPMSAARARNKGFQYLVNRYSIIEFVHFVDGDCEMIPSWIDAAVNALQQNKDIGVVCGRLREKDRDLNIYGRIFDIGWYIPPGEIEGCGGIATIRKTTFEEIQGFNEKMIAGEEPDMCSRIRKKGWKMICLDSKMAIHDGAMNSFRQWWTRQNKVGYGYAYGVHWGGYPQQRRSVWIWSFIIPLIITLVAILSGGIGIVAIAIYPIQILRVAWNFWRQRLKADDAVLYAAFCQIAKFPQMEGILRFYFEKKLGNQGDALDYKNKKHRQN